ncbi:hypothetical protein F4780DRAFT_723517 [Xylariomycetidae sp. FL0641]|nr:hypothetical protein F4780DRAFT_723517 [Xylariomycetidae sp. FL0641]
MQYTFLSAVLFTAGSQALFECNSDQHAFPPTEGTFVVHYTSTRDTNLDGEPWIRICLPDGESWTETPPLETPCDDATSTFYADQTGLYHILEVTNGNGCDTAATDLTGASLVYNDVTIDLQNAGSGECGDRDHGISCQFQLD